MSKEIEALDGLAQFIIMNDNGTDESASAIEWHNILTEALKHAKKAEELLELYRKHINNLCKQEREGVKNSLFSSEFIAYELYEQIKQKEKELEELK